MGKRGLAKALYQIASTQQGYFTARQAKEAGYSYTRFAYHVRQGNWEKEGRGIYRLTDFPSTERPDLVYWSLWSCDHQGNVQGVFSHLTALAIHELSDANPARYDLTVPTRFRKYNPIPPNIILHRNGLDEIDIQEMDGYRVTSPVRTILDVIADDTCQEEIVVQAIVEALERGVLTRRELKGIILKCQAERALRIMREVDQYE